MKFMPSEIHLKYKIVKKKGFPLKFYQRVYNSSTYNVN